MTGAQVTVEACDLARAAGRSFVEDSRTLVGELITDPDCQSAWKRIVRRRTEAVAADVRAAGGSANDARRVSEAFRSGVLSAVVEQRSAQG